MSDVFVISIGECDMIFRFCSKQMKILENERLPCGAAFVVCFLTHHMADTHTLSSHFSTTWPNASLSNENRTGSKSRPF
jgi:hypothetical protein